jgi:hypothetical protein
VRVALGGHSGIIEVPIGTLSAFGKTWPLGGGYGRLTPQSALVWAIRSASARAKDPVFYCHPYEQDPGEFAASTISLPLKVKLHQGLGRRGTASKLRMMLRRFECISVQQAIDDLALPVIERSSFQSTSRERRPPAFRGSPIGTRRSSIDPRNS